jgi:hypothetical protein
LSIHEVGKNKHIWPVVADPAAAMLTNITVKAVREEIKSIQDRLAYVAAILDSAQLTYVLAAGRACYF